MHVWILCLALVLGVCTTASASTGKSYEHCFLAAAERHTVNPDILRAIASVESSNRPHAVNRNPNGSYDYGLMQINSIHLPELAKYGIGRHDLMEPCVSIHVAAFLLSRHMRRFGNTWDAIGAYQSVTEGIRQAYAQKVYEHLP